MPATLHYKQNRFQQLRGFCAAARLGSVSKAAAEMGVSQPTVTLQVQALERELGVRLFERRGPRITLTPDGQMLLDMAQGLVREMDTLGDRFAARRGRVDAGRLDIAAGGSTILYLLPDFVGKFAAQYPGIELKLHNVTGRDGVSLLVNDQVDLAVGTMIDKRDDMVFTPLFSFDPVLIAPLDHPLAKRQRVTIRDVAKYPLILPPSHLTTWGVVEKTFQKHDLRPHVKLEVGSWEVIKEYVRRGLGISIVTSICLTKDEQLAVIPMERYFPKRSYGIVVRRGKVLSPQAERFIQILRG
jgi:DNA-binding transcriptional LysR family regulator